MFPRPEEPYVRVERERVDGACPGCGHQALARYPVVSEHGWELVTKCQDCLCSVAREPWHRLGHVTLLSDALR